MTRANKLVHIFVVVHLYHLYHNDTTLICRDNIFRTRREHILRVDVILLLLLL